MHTNIIKFKHSLYSSKEKHRSQIDSSSMHQFQMSLLTTGLLRSQWLTTSI